MKRIFAFVFISILLSCKQKTTAPLSYGEEDMWISKLSMLDQEMPVPQPNDWLFNHKEPGQSFEQYTAAKPVRVDSVRKYIYLRPVGDFSVDQLRIVNYTADYLRVFFNVDVIVDELVSEEIIPASARRMFSASHEQLLTTYIFDRILLPEMPEDAAVVMAITTKDLYPGGSYNYVFGQARLKERVGVTSMFRYTDEPLNQYNFNQCLTRMIKTSSHEIGHMFTCHHCTHAICVMNGTNGLWESDSRPNRLCSECLRKLHWNLGFDVERRQKKLVEFMAKHQLVSDRDVLAKDLQVLQSEKPSGLKGLYD